MSRIGKKPVPVPAGVTATIENGTLSVKGPKGTLSIDKPAGIDVKIEDGVPVPALKGWTQSSGVTLWEALDRYPKGTAKHLLVTDVGRDGAMTGPNLELLAEIRDELRKK